LDDIPHLNWEAERIHNSKFRDLKSSNSYEVYQAEFKRHPEYSDINKSRIWLRDFWNTVLQTIPKEHMLWHPNHQDGLLMKARNHLNLIEPIDEAVYQKVEFWSDSGSYWASSNRPYRYDTIEEILTFYNNGNTDRFTQNTTHVSKREKLSQMLSEVGLTLKHVESHTFNEITNICNMTKQQQSKLSSIENIEEPLFLWPDV